MTCHRLINKDYADKSSLCNHPESTATPVERTLKQKMKLAQTNIALLTVNSVDLPFPFEPLKREGK